jgi:hypothetical protein
MPLELRGYIIDSQTMSAKMKKPHHTARAGLTYNKICRDTMTFNRPAIELQLHRDFNKEHPHWVDKEDNYQFAPHQRSYAIRELHRKFFGEHDALLNQKRIRQQQECVGGWLNDIWKSEENVTEEETNENPRKKAFSCDTTKKE